MESTNTDLINAGKKIVVKDAFKLGLGAVVMVVVTYGMWLLFNSERTMKDRQITESMTRMQKDIEDLKKDNKECNDFTKSVLLKEVQESNALQSELRDFLKRKD